MDKRVHSQMNRPILAARLQKLICERGNRLYYLIIMTVLCETAVKERQDTKPPCLVAIDGYLCEERNRVPISSSQGSYLQGKQGFLD